MGCRVIQFGYPAVDFCHVAFDSSIRRFHMPPRSRRALLAAAGTALLAGCGGGSSDPDTPPAGSTAHPTRTATRTATSTASTPFPVEPLGVRAVPPDAPAPPGFARERVLDGDEGVDATAVTGLDGGLRVLLTRSGSGSSGGDPADGGPSILVDTDERGRERRRRRLLETPTPRPFFLQQVADTTVVSGIDTTSTQSWLQGYRDGARTFQYRRDPATTFVAFTTDEADLLAAGTTGWGSDEDFGAVVTRLGADGSVRGDLPVDDPGADERFWSLATTADGILAGGSRDSEAWLVRFDAAGGRRWQRTLTREPYVVTRVAAGGTGTYALARTEQFAQGDNHLALVSLDGDGTVEWVRVFDPNGEDRPGATDLSAAGLVDAGGPVVVGRADAATWLAATTPDGTVRWAGYSRREGAATRPVATVTLGDSLLLHGSVGSPADDTAVMRPWLAWLAV